jgi:hypothetical protein
MTIVLACKFLKTIVMISDSRVSYGHKDPVDDNLQKLYPLDERMVIGFSGPLAGAHQVLSSVARNRKNYSKPPIAANLLTDVDRWIRHEYRQIKPSTNREGLSFIIATVEPKRERRSRWFTQQGEEKSKPNWFPFVPQLRSIALKPSKSNPKELTKYESEMCKIIGVQSNVQEHVNAVVEKLFGFSFNRPLLQAQAIVNTLMYVLMEQRVVSVGGLFQCAVLGENGIEWLTYGHPSKQGDVSLEIIDGKYVQRDNITGRTIPLKNIWDWYQDWQKEQRPGSSGIFEDPGLRKAAEDKSLNDIGT